VDLSVDAEQSGLPGLGRDQVCLMEQADGTGEEIVEVLYGDVDGARLVDRHRDGLAVCI